MNLYLVYEKTEDGVTVVIQINGYLMHHRQNIEGMVETTAIKLI